MKTLTDEQRLLADFACRVCRKVDEAATCQQRRCFWNTIGNENCPFIREALQETEEKNKC